MELDHLLGAERRKLDHLLVIDDLKLCAKNTKQMDSLVQTVRIFRDYVKMEFGTQKFAMVELKRGKMIQSNGMDLVGGQKLKSLEEGEDTGTRKF